MKIEIGRSGIDLSFGDIANLIVMKEILKLEQRITDLENRVKENHTKKPVNDLKKLGEHIEKKKSEKLKNKSFYWTKNRHDILRENFYKKTIEELMAMLPGSTREEILDHAAFHGLDIEKIGGKNGAGSHS